jgi:hypothetical protein
MQPESIVKFQLTNGVLGTVVLVLMILEFSEGNYLAGFVDVACLANSFVLILSIRNLKYSRSTDSKRGSGRVDLRLPLN